MKIIIVDTPNITVGTYPEMPVPRMGEVLWISKGRGKEDQITQHKVLLVKYDLKAKTIILSTEVIYGGNEYFPETATIGLYSIGRKNSNQ